MSIDPTTIIGEILGEPAADMRNPVNAGYRCPFVSSDCIKRGQQGTDPYPVCSLWRGSKGKQRLISVCPKRFFQVNFLGDILENCWKGTPPEEPHIAYEVQMKDFGKVDFVIADVDKQNRTVREFISVELQAVDITGSAAPAYNAVINSQLLARRPSFGFNWGNVRKRYVSQLIAKGFFHHHWKSRIVAVLQVPVYEKFREYIHFDEMPKEQGNIIFMLYDYSETDPYQLELKRIVSTSHNSLMTGSLYRTPPEKSEYIKRIMLNLNRDGSEKRSV